MVAIKFNGKQPTLSAMKDMSRLMKDIEKHGSKITKNRYFVYEGSIMRAGQETKKVAMRYMKPNYTLFSIFVKSSIRRKK